MKQTESKKKEMAHKMHGGTKQRATHGSHVGGEYAHSMVNKGKKDEGEFYRMTGDRPHEGTGGEKARQAGRGMENTKGEKATQANKKGSFSDNK